MVLPVKARWFLTRPRPRRAGLLTHRRRNCGRAITGGRHGVLVAEIDPPFGSGRTGHLDRNAVAGEDADSILLHLARRIGQRLMPVVERTLNRASGTVRARFFSWRKVNVICYDCINWPLFLLDGACLYCRLGQMR